MIKKFLFRFSVGFLSLFAVLSLGSGWLLLSKIESFQKVTHEEVLSQKSRRDHYGIGQNRNPADYGFNNFMTLKYRSTLDQTKLEAWFVPSPNKKTNRALVLVHGMGANKLRTTKYLRLIRDHNLHQKYAIMIPDMRNSGHSQSAKVAMGYKFAEDLHASLIVASKKFSIQKFTIFAFSMGAMATQILLNRPELYEDIKAKGLRIEKIIFDSPLVNAKESLLFLGRKKGFPAFVLKYGFWVFNQKMNGFAEKMRLHILYKDQKIPLLILQAKDDPKGFYPALIDEMKHLDNKSVQVKYFPTGAHVKIYQHPKMKTAYEQTVVPFLR